MKTMTVDVVNLKLGHSLQYRGVSEMASRTGHTLTRISTEKLSVYFKCMGFTGVIHHPMLVHCVEIHSASVTLPDMLLSHSVQGWKCSFKGIFMIWIYSKPLMRVLYFVAFYMTVTPLSASARKALCYLWSQGISFTAVCQSSEAYDSSL